MKYWIDVENGEYGTAANTTDLPGLRVTGEGPVESHQTKRMAAQARELGGVLVMESLDAFQVVFGALESAMGMSFIYSPVAPTCAENRPTRLGTMAIRGLGASQSDMRMAA